MSRGIFNSNNKTTEVFTFKTNSDSGTTFDPQFSSNSIGSNRRVHIDYGDGSLGYDAELYPSHTYSDNGDVKDVNDFILKNKDNILKLEWSIIKNYFTNKISDKIFFIGTKL